MELSKLSSVGYHLHLSTSQEGKKFHKWVLLQLSFTILGLKPHKLSQTFVKHSCLTFAKWCYFDELLTKIEPSSTTMQKKQFYHKKKPSLNYKLSYSIMIN